MTDPGPARLTGPPTAATPVFLGTFALILAAIGGFLVLDFFLAGIDSGESKTHAANLYADGVTDLSRGNADKAIEHFGAALSIDRSNVNYALGLAEARFADGQIVEAEATMTPLLERAGNDGAVNLTMAHITLKQGKVGEAKAYYHRAIFGRWGADSIARRSQARFELIDLFAQMRARAELLAELLPFETVSPDSIALRRRLGLLFIEAGSPNRGITMLREVLRQNPNDAGAYAGMGEAALALGNFRTARRDFSEAARLEPKHPEFAARLAFADTVASLDPTVPGIGARERATRARALLARTLQRAAKCPDWTPPQSADSLLEADDMVVSAIHLWETLSPQCPLLTNDEALRLVHVRLAQ
jgi:tetratricopeptide (TPR) repeat protein